jgi:hypothetical protein
MSKIKFIFVIITLTTFHVSKGQVIWKETKDWKIYNVTSRLMIKIGLDSLSNLRSYPLNLDSVQAFLSSVNKIPKDSTPLAWMGGVLATCTYQGKMRKVQISSYGGWFFDQETKLYFEVPRDQAADWYSYISDCLVSIQ